MNDRQVSFIESDISEISIADYEKLFNISKNTARKDLIQLTESNFVDKLKRGKIVIFKRI